MVKTGVLGGGRGMTPVKVENEHFTWLKSMADQHLKAANALGAFEDVTFPQLHSAALSIEFHFMAYASYAGATIAEESSAVIADLREALHLLPPYLRSALSEAFSHHHGGSLEEQLEKFNHAFTEIRHHFQIPDFYKGFDLVEFMHLARFFGKFEFQT